MTIQSSMYYPERSGDKFPIIPPLLIIVDGQAFDSRKK